MYITNRITAIIMLNNYSHIQYINRLGLATWNGGCGGGCHASLARSVWRVPVWRVPVWRDPLWRDSTLARSTLTRFRHIPYYLVSLVYIHALSGSACDTCVNCDYVRNYVTVCRVDIL